MNDTLDRLHTRLERDAADAGLLDLAYATVDSPVGPLLLVASERGLTRVAFDREDHDAVLATLATQRSPRILRSRARLSEPSRQLDAYFSGGLTRFDLPLDLGLTAGFRQVVQRHLPSIAFGSTRSYAEIAADVGRPRAIRAVGTACATNPLPIVVPCHRVLRSDGSLGGYLGGLDAKRILLDLEQQPGTR